MTTVAVTGATGFVGSHLLDVLVRKGIKVRALTRKPQPARIGVSWIAGSLTDPTSLKQLVSDSETIIHVAGAIKAITPDVFQSVNVEGTRALIEACLAGSVKRFIHVSSLAARRPDLSDYAASKAEAEQVVGGVDLGSLSWMILRPPAVYGPGDRETFAMFRSASLGLALLPNRNSRLSLIHVRDLAAALVACLSAEKLVGQTIEVHDGVQGGYALRDLYQWMGHALGRPVLPLVPPAFALNLVARISTALLPRLGRAPMLTPGKVRELLYPDWTTNDNRLPELGNWQADIPATVGIAQTARWYVKQGWL